MTRRFDYVVVGAGSSGAAVAARLSEAGASVLLLEAGAAREKDFWVKVPIGIARILANPAYVWQFHTEPQPGLAGQRVYWPRGRLPGGSSSVNGMIFVRGEPAEFDHWRDLGNTGWGWDDVLPYFKRLEATRVGDDAWRGRGGPIRVSHLAETPDELSDAFMWACIQSGIPANADYNGGSYEGVSYLQLSTHRGMRSSTATGYLHRGDSRPVLETQAVASRILFDGRKAVGVEYLRAGVKLQVHADREVLLCAGPINSPKLLELSGVGHGPRLQALSIPVVADLPGVGESLIDHLQSRLTLACSRRITLNEIVGRPLREAWMGARYLVSRRGLMATPACTIHALARSHAQQLRPNVKIQLHHLSGGGRFEVAGASGGPAVDVDPGFSIGFFQLRPESRGSVHITDLRPHAAPCVDPRYLSEEVDRVTMLDALRLARKVTQSPALADYVLRETRPGADVRSDEELLAYIRNSGQTSFHPVGTCRMGRDGGAVVDARLRVHGLCGLRVVDSSIMPTMPASNTNAASIMIGERAADLILEDAAAAR